MRHSVYHHPQPQDRPRRNVGLIMIRLIIVKERGGLIVMQCRALDGIKGLNRRAKKILQMAIYLTYKWCVLSYSLSLHLLYFFFHAVHHLYLILIVCLFHTLRPLFQSILSHLINTPLIITYIYYLNVVG